MKSRDFLVGAREALPIVIAYVPLGFAFGVLAVEAGLTPLEAVFMSVMCFTGAGQYIAIGMLKAQAAATSIIIANLLANLRYFLFSASLVPHLNKIPVPIASLLAYGTTDETFAVAARHYQEEEATTGYVAGLNLTSHASWIGSTALGAVLGQVITDTEAWGLNFAIPAMYAGLLVLIVKTKRDLIVAVIAPLLCLVIAWLFPSSLKSLANVIIATLAAATLGVVIRDEN